MVYLRLSRTRDDERMLCEGSLEPDLFFSLVEKIGRRVLRQGLPDGQGEKVRSPWIYWPSQYYQHIGYALKLLCVSCRFIERKSSKGEGYQINRELPIWLVVQIFLLIDLKIINAC